MLPKNHDKLLAWILANSMRTSNGIPFEFYEHRFSIEPLTDYHPIQGINKAAQLGITEEYILKTMFMAKELGLNVGYSLNSSKDMDNFVKTKFDPIMRANRILDVSIEGNTEKKVVKYHDGSERFIHLIGAYNSASSSQKEKSAVGISFTADVLIQDEASRSDQYVLDQLQSRTMNSLYKWNWKFDNPLYPSTGADKIYKISDQRHWIVKCTHCGWNQYLDWFRLDKHIRVKSEHCFIDPDRKLFICSKCGKEINDEARLSGRWVAKFPKVKDYRGYWMSQMIYVRHHVSDILRYETDMTPSVFANMVLGKPYIGSDITVSRQVILDNIKSRPSEPVAGQVAMGIDQGREKQYWLKDKQGTFLFGRTKDWSEIEMIFNKYQAIAVCDADPETGEPKKLALKYPGRFFRAKFSPEADQKEVAKFGTKADRTLVLIRKHEAFDLLANRYNNFEQPINLHANQIGEILEEYSNQVRIVEEDNFGNQKYRWEKIGECDLPYAELYADIALTRVRSEPLGKVSGFKKPMIYYKETQAPLTPAQILKNIKK